MIKKLSISIFFFLIAFSLYSAKITVKVFDDTRISFSLKEPGSGQFDAGKLLINQTYLSTTYNGGRIVLKNNGEVRIGFSLALKMISSGVVPVDKQPGKDEFRLFGMFHQWDSNPLESYFESDDIITAEYQDCSTNVFARPGSKDEYKGFQVESGMEQSLFLRFDSPTGVSQEPSVVNFKLLIKAFMPIEQEEEHKKPEEKIFTPNGDGINDLLVFHGLSEKLSSSAFQIKIFDVRGRLIRAIDDVEYWDGKDSEGEYVRTGVYLYQYIYENKYITGVAVIAR